MSAEPEDEVISQRSTVSAIASLGRGSITESTRLSSAPGETVEEGFEVAAGAAEEKHNDDDDDDDVINTTTSPTAAVPAPLMMTASHVNKASVISVQTCYKDLGQAAAIDRAFQELDLQNTGRLDRTDLTAFMEEACTLVKLKVSHTLIEDAVEALLEDVGAETQNFISKQQFQNLFDRHPDLLTCFEDEDTASLRQSSIRHASETEVADDLQAEEIENEQVWVHAHTHWKSQRVEYLWGIVYLMANVICFAYSKGTVYANRDDATNVFGNCIVVARGSAMCLNLNCALILLPMCRHFLTRARARPWLQNYFPFDAYLEYHILIGCVIAIFAITHICAHMCDFYRFARADEEDIYELFGTKLGIVPSGIGERWVLLLRQPAGITGIIMTVCLLVAYPLTQIRRKHFNLFWGTHHLLLVMLVALCCHGIGSLLEPFQSVYWLISPLSLYLIPRLWRETPLSVTKVKEIAIKGGNVVGLKLERPKSWDAVIRAGQYAFLNIPKVSCVEWHPFTLTSAPSDDYIEFHFANVGDWTGAVHDLLESLCPTDNNKNTTTSHQATQTEAAIKNLVVKVEGPMGASTQGFKDYPVVVLIGAGVGITPMISVLRDLLVDHGKMKRTFFYWTTRDRKSFEWFTQLMDDIFDSDPDNIIQIRHFLTSMKEDRDLEAVLFHHATRARYHKTNFDIILGQHTHHQVEVGRPNWEEELESVKIAAKEINCSDCGIFLCGPERMADAVDEVSFTMSKKDPDFHFYFTKETF